MPLPAKKLPTQNELLEMFIYEPDTGALFWRKNGKLAGSKSKHGYYRVGIGSRSNTALHMNHRVIWKMMTGRDPEPWIDHDDGDRGNNRWSNLREATNRQNVFNAKTPVTNTSGYRGVSFIQAHQKYRAAISIDGKKKHLGYYDSPEEAAVVAAYEIRRTRGAFARER